jgi:hypothetical protein
MNPRLRGHIPLTALLPLFLLLSQPGPGFGQKKEEPVPQVWIYRDVPREGETDTLTPSERYFQPFFFFPEAKVSKIVVNDRLPADKLDLDAKGTCVEFTFGLEGADDFAGAGFIPGGKLGAKPPRNVAEKLLVGGRSVYLKFRARAKEGQTVRARFEACGLSFGDYADGIELPLTPHPDVTVLKDKWQAVTIDLTKKAEGLESVFCPLKVIVRYNENPGKDEVTVYVDDIRFEVGDNKDK